LKARKRRRPQPFLQVPRGSRQEQVHLVSNEAFQEAAHQPILVFQVTDYRFNRRPAPEARPHLC
jgi:hypothetical protein